MSFAFNVKAEVGFYTPSVPLPESIPIIAPVLAVDYSVKFQQDVEIAASPALVQNQMLATQLINYNKISECPNINTTEHFSYNGNDDKARTILSYYKVKAINNKIYYKVDPRASASFENAIYEAMLQYERAGNIRLIKTTDTCDAQIYITPVSKNTELKENIALLSDSAGAGQTNWINGRAYLTINSSDTPLDETWLSGTILHEIGHALGLKHSGPYQAQDHGPFLLKDEDFADNTVMSYNVRQWGKPAQLGPFDKRAIALLYGPSRNNSDMMIFPQP